MKCLTDYQKVKSRSHTNELLIVGFGIILGSIVGAQSLISHSGIGFAIPGPGNR